jgi:tetratricopeptide (TPR) repeat protein
MLPPAPSQIPALYKQALAVPPDVALAIYARILLTRTDIPEVHFQIGRIHAAQGDRAKAEAALRKALSLKPAESAIWQALAGVLAGEAARKLASDAARAGIVMGSALDAAPIFALIAAGKAEAAEVKAMTLVKAAPQAASPAHALGAARAAQGKWAGAYGPLDMALTRDPGNADVMALLGQACVKIGRPIRAELLLTAAAGRGGTLALAELYRETCRLDDARAILATAKPPKGAAALAELSLLLASLGQVQAARKMADRALAAGAAPAALLAPLASFLADAGDTRAADAALAKALRAVPGDAALLTQRAQMRQSDGDMAGAEADLAKAIHRKPPFAEALRAYTAGRKMTADDPVLPVLEARLAAPDLPRLDRRLLSFAMAKATEDLGQTARVFPLLDRANGLMRADFPYDFAADVADMRALLSQYSDRLAGLDSTGPADPAIFVTGPPRSGTTLVETILSAHPRVSAGGEMGFLRQALSPMQDMLGQGQTPTPADFAFAGTRYLRAARQRAGTTDIVTDKAIATFARIGHAAMALPGARFVVLERDPRDVGLSIYRNMFADGRHRYSTDLRDIGRYLRLQEAAVNQWDTLLPGRIHRVSYDALTATPEPVIRALVAFCGLDWNDACLSPETVSRRVETLSFAQVRRPISRGSVAGWRKYADALAPLLAGLAEPVSLT